MSERKIGKKIFRRTRKHKFYGIKAKKRPSMITRKRVRRGGVEDVVHSVIGNYASRNLFLTKPKCNELLKKATAAQEQNPGKIITYTPNAVGDKKYCQTTYGIDIDERVDKVNHVNLMNEEISIYNKHQQEKNDFGISREQYDLLRDAEDAKYDEDYDKNPKGGSKSRRTRRRKHKRKRHSRAARKHKKHTSRR